MCRESNRQRVRNLSGDAATAVPGRIGGLFRYERTRRMNQSLVSPDSSRLLIYDRTEQLAALFEVFSGLGCDGR